MHWLNMSAQTAGTEVIIQNIKQHCRQKKKIFVVLYLRKSLNAHKKKCHLTVSEKLLEMERL